jgi:hypothetical protein
MNKPNKLECMLFNNLDANQKLNTETKKLLMDQSPQDQLINNIKSVTPKNQLL